MRLSKLWRWLLPSPRALRVWFYCTSVFCGLTLISARALYAQVREGALAFGRELAGLSDLTEGSEALVANGVLFHHASVVVQGSLPEVLDRLETYCATNSALLGRSLQDIDRRYTAASKLRSGLGHAIVREQAADRGMVVCFVDARPSGLEDLEPALARFLETGDLTAFGGFVYSYAEERDDGTTRVVTLRAERGIDLSKMFPASGDAAGSDSSVVPRPPGARRTLSAAADRKAYGLRVYASSENTATLESFYDEWMRRRGWTRAAKDGESRTATYLRADGYQVFVSLSENEGLTYVTLVEAGRSKTGSIASVGFSE